METLGVLYTFPMNPYLEEQLSKRCKLFRLYESSPETRKDYIRSNAASIRAIVGTSNAGADAETIDALPNLEIVASFSVGLDKVDLQKCRERGIRVTNTPDVLTDDVADLAIGLAIAVMRKICDADRYVRSGAWKTKGDFKLTTKFGGKTMGIVGLGRIGSAIAKRAKAKRAKACEYTISYYYISEKRNTCFMYFSNILDLAAACQVLVVSCLLTEETQHVINSRVIDALVPNCVLIIIGWGAHVDEPELIGVA